MSERASHKKKTVTMQPKTAAEAWVSDGKERTTTKAERTKRLTLDIPEDMHRALKRRALDEDTTMLDVVERWIRQGLQGK